MSDSIVEQGAGLLARVVRGGVTESAHYGHLVILNPDGSTKFQVGNPDVVIFARSSLKPLQLVASLRSGFSPNDAEQLAVATSSHNGEPKHLAAVRSILTASNLTETDLQNTPGLPLNPEAALEWQINGNGPESITQNCSGKHAAMLAACVASGWEIESYRQPDHPLQLRVAQVIKELTGDVEPPQVTVDGCGAPLFSTTLSGLARAFRKIATAPSGSPENQVARAMQNHPDLVGGTGRDVTSFMQAVPGLICKDGAEGVYAGALPDGTAFAFKILDGSGRARPAIFGRILELTGASEIPGYDAEVVKSTAEVPVLGHGQPVGQVIPAF